MIEIKNKEKCCGCHGCTNVCPKQCISMEVDKEGFWYPKVDKSKCVNCTLCEKVCPIINRQQRGDTEIFAYACKNINDEVRESSSSGGVFILLCEEVINNGGVVFGAAFDEKFNVIHTYAETIEESNRFRGSKYVQSKVGNTYKKAKEFLDKGKIVLFSGTPCQISGLDAYLMKKYDNLILIDIACHGVPSPLVYRSYINKLVKKKGTNIKEISFRDKSTGWKDYSVSFKFKNGKELKQFRIDNTYMNGYLKDIFLRPSCYNCKFKKPVTSADLTLADYWGVQNKHPEFDDDKGTSLILVNSKKGQNLLNKITNKLKIIPTDFEYATKCNPSIIKSSNYNKERDEFFLKFSEQNVIKNIKKYTKLPIILRIKINIARVIKRKNR